MKGKHNPPGDDLDRLMDDVAAELGDLHEVEPPGPGLVVDFQAWKASNDGKGVQVAPVTADKP